MPSFGLTTGPAALDHRGGRRAGPAMVPEAAASAHLVVAQ
jgi:hypothetical protein